MFSSSMQRKAATGFLTSAFCAITSSPGVIFTTSGLALSACRLPFGVRYAGCGSWRPALTCWAFTNAYWTDRLPCV